MDAWGFTNDDPVDDVFFLKPTFTGKRELVVHSEANPWQSLDGQTLPPGTVMTACWIETTPGIIDLYGDMSYFIGDLEHRIVPRDGPRGSYIVLPDALPVAGQHLLSTNWFEASDFSRKIILRCAEGAPKTLNPLTLVGGGSVAKNLTEPLTYQAVETTFRIWRKTLGLKAKPYSLHGLRKLSIIQLAEAGASDAEIQAVTGQSAEMVAYYRAKASRKALSKSAQKRRE